MHLLNKMPRTSAVDAPAADQSRAAYCERGLSAGRWPFKAWAPYPEVGRCTRSCPYLKRAWFQTSRLSVETPVPKHAFRNATCAATSRTKSTRIQRTTMMMIRRMTITAARGERRRHPWGGGRDFDMISSLPGIIFVGQKLNKGVLVATRQQYKLPDLFLYWHRPRPRADGTKKDTPKTNDGVIDSYAF